jgi:hypothetical protein
LREGNIKSQKKKCNQNDFVHSFCFFNTLSYSAKINIQSFDYFIDNLPSGFVLNDNPEKNTPAMLLKLTSCIFAGFPFRKYFNQKSRQNLIISLEMMYFAAINQLY